MAAEFSSRVLKERERGGEKGEGKSKPEHQAALQAPLILLSLLPSPLSLLPL